jgi:hypothetical protein
MSEKVGQAGHLNAVQFSEPDRTKMKKRRFRAGIIPNDDRHNQNGNDPNPLRSRGPTSDPIERALPQLLELFIGHYRDHIAAYFTRYARKRNQSSCCGGVWLKLPVHQDEVRGSIKPNSGEPLVYQHQFRFIDQLIHPHETFSLDQT